MTAPAEPSGSFRTSFPLLGGTTTQEDSMAYLLAAWDGCTPFVVLRPDRSGVPWAISFLNGPQEYPVDKTPTRN